MLTVLNVAYPFAPVGPDAVGGAEQILSAIDAAATAAGHRSLVLACEGSRSAGRLHAFTRPKAPLTPEVLDRFAAWLRSQIERIIEREGVDIVHFHGIGFERSVPRGRTPVLATLHLPPAWYTPAIFAPARPNTWLNCVSRSQRKACPRSGALIEDIPNGVNLSRFLPVRRRDRYALVLGRVCPEKGIHLAVEAARWAGVPLVIAGKVFPYPEHVRYFRERVQPHLGPSCLFLGPVAMPRKAELLARARCVLVPSLVDETSSLVTMEALASGAPVVALPKGALADLVDHRRTGFLVNDVREMKEAIVNAARLGGDRCRRAAEERFGLARMCERYLAVYQRLTMAARAPRLAATTA